MNWRFVFNRNTISRLIVIVIQAYREFLVSLAHQSRESFIMGYLVAFGCHGNTCYVIFVGAVFCMIHIICPINVCTDV